MLGHVLWHVRHKQAVALPMDKMCRVRAADDIDFINPNFFFFADALEHALRSRSLHADGNTRILGFEYLAEGFCGRNCHSSVERDHAFLPSSLDHGRADRGWLWRRTLERLRKNSAKCHSHRCVEHITSRKLPISHGVRSPDGGLWHFSIAVLG